MQKCIRMLVATIVIAVCCGMTVPATADTYPSRPITIIVPFAAGGPFDTIARIIAEGMRGLLGQPIIIEDVAGAAGSLGVGRVARASPDGYTLSIGNWGTHVVNGAMYSLSYDTFADFEPIALLSNSPELIVAKSAVPANNLKQFIAYLKNNSDKASMGTSGVGSSGHVAGFLFQKATGTSFQFVPYRGLAPAMQDLIGGRTDMMIDMPSNSLPYIRSGAIKAFAVMDKQAWRRLRTFRQSMRRDCRVFMRRSGMRYGPRKACSWTSSPNRMQRGERRSPIPPCKDDRRRSTKPYFLLSNRHRRPLSIINPRSTSGGSLSRTTRLKFIDLPS